MPPIFYKLYAPPFSWQSLAGLGDTIFVAPAAVVIAAGLIWNFRERVPAKRWIAVWIGAGSLVVASKMAYTIWGLHVARIDFIGFSGHSTFSALVWPTAFWLMTTDKSLGIRRSAVALGCVVALAVSLSRLMVNAHSLSEVAGGLAIGLIGSAWFLTSSLKAAPVSHAIAKATVCLLTVVAVAFNGYGVPTDLWQTAIAEKLIGVRQPFGRSKLADPLTPFPK